MKKWERPVVENLEMMKTANLSDRAFLGTFKCVKCDKVYQQDEANLIGGTCNNVVEDGKVCKGDLQYICSCS